MNDLSTVRVTLPLMGKAELDLVRRLEAHLFKQPQCEVETDHILHAGMYARTAYVKAGMVFTGVLIKVPTILIISGDVTVYTGMDSVRLTGYNVLMGSAGRKQAFVTHSDISFTMLFPSQAKSVEEAEREFTDEYEMLMSRRTGNHSEVKL